MSYQLQVDEDSNEYLVDGKFLSKSELIERLLKMNIELDNKVEGKQYFVDMYNKLIQNYDRRMKIKSILEADMQQRTQKNLSKKRERDVIGESELNSSKELTKEELGNNLKFKIEKTANSQNEEKEKNQEEEDANRNNQNNIAANNLDLQGFMMKIHADLNSYKNRIKNFEGALIEIKKNQSDKEQPKVNYNDNFNFPQSDSRVLSKKPSQRNSRTNMRSVEASSKNFPHNSYDKKVQISSNNKFEIYLNENQKEEEKTPADSSESDSDVIADFSIKQPHNRRRNGLILESTASFPKIESRNSRKSLPGSSKNIQEILNKIDSRSNPTISPRLTNISNKSFVFKSFKGENSMPIQASQKGNSNSRMSSSRQLIITVRENTSNVSEFATQRDGETITRNISTISNTVDPVNSKIFNFKNVSYLIYYSIITNGVIQLAYLLLNLSNYKGKDIILIALVFFGLVCVIFYKNIMSKRFFRKTAKEDYILIKNIILNLYSAQENPIGLFESNILKDFSMKHKMSEANYKKYVFPIIKNLRDSENVIIEAEIIIQEQSQNVWKLK